MLFIIVRWLNITSKSLLTLPFAVGVSWHISMEQMLLETLQEIALRREIWKKKKAGMQVLISVLKEYKDTFSSLFPEIFPATHTFRKKVHTVIFLDEICNYEKSKTTRNCVSPRKICAEIVVVLLPPWAETAQAGGPQSWNMPKSSCCLIQQGSCVLELNATLIADDRSGAYSNQGRGHL